MPDLPAFVNRKMNSMILPDVLGILIFTEKFKLSNIVNEGVEELENLSPIYKSIYDEYIGSDPDFGEEPFYQGLNDPTYTGGPQPIFRVLFDWTSPLARSNGTSPLVRSNGTSKGGERWPIQVQMRVQLVEPQADTIAPMGSRRFLRGGNLQFLIHTANDITIEDGRPTSEIFKVAQFYVDKYGSKNVAQIFNDLEDVKNGLNGDFTISQFNDLDSTKLKMVLEKIFPYINLRGDASSYYNQIFSYIKTFQTFAAVTANLRFAPLNRPNLPQQRLVDPQYGLAVTIPFTYEQIK